MPCVSDYGPDPAELRRSQEAIAKREKEARLIKATLCGILRVLEVPYDQGKIFELVDWKEAGVKRSDAEAWWNKHKMEDDLRRAKEAAEAHKKEIKKNALSKLAPEERAVLGL